MGASACRHPRCSRIWAGEHVRKFALYRNTCPLETHRNMYIYIYLFIYYNMCVSENVISPLKIVSVRREHNDLTNYQISWYCQINAIFIVQALLLSWS